MRKYGLFAFFCLLFLPGWKAWELPNEEEGHIKAIHAAKIYLEDGRVISDGLVILQQDRIELVGTNLKVPEGAMVLSLQDGELTAGLIDAASTAGTGPSPTGRWTDPVGWAADRKAEPCSWWGLTLLVSTMNNDWV